MYVRSYLFPMWDKNIMNKLVFYYLKTGGYVLYTTIINTY